MSASSSQNPYACLELKNQVCFPLYACSKELIRQYGPALSALNLTYTQYLVMMALWEQETISSKDLSNCLHLDFGTLTPVVRRLEQSGYLQRKRSVDDERILMISLTDNGRALKDQAVHIPPSIAACMGLSDEEFGTLYTLLYKALGYMEQHEGGTRNV